MVKAPFGSPGPCVWINVIEIFTLIITNIDQYFVRSRIILGKI
jgi:hypothetical protein